MVEQLLHSGVVTPSGLRIWANSLQAGQGDAAVQIGSIDYRAYAADTLAALAPLFTRILGDNRA